jgi:hypothetical protein
MSIPRVAGLFLLSLFCLATLAAQASPDSNFVASPPKIGALENPFRHAPADPFKFQVTPPPDASGANLLMDVDSGGTHVVYPQMAGAESDGAGGSTCYSMRSYRVKRENPHTDAVEPAGYTVCQPAKRFQLKSAIYEPGPPKR